MSHLHFPPVEALPEIMRALASWPVWVAWKSVAGRKIPHDKGGNRTGYNRPEAWDSYTTWRRDFVLTRPEAVGLYDGIGISAVAMARQRDRGLDLIMIDIDDCISDGTVAPWARDIVLAAASYTEVSPSGTGLRILGGAAGWPTTEAKRNWQAWELRQVAGDVLLEPTGRGETYYGTGFCTITFRVLEGYEGLWNPGLGAIAAGLPRFVPERLSTGGRDKGDGDAAPGAPLEIIGETLGFIPNDQAAALDWETYNLVGMSIWRATDGMPEGLELFRRWAEQCPYHLSGREGSKGGPETAEERWKHYHGSPPEHLGYGKLHYLARAFQERAGRTWRGGPLFKAHQSRKRVEELKATPIPVELRDPPHIGNDVGSVAGPVAGPGTASQTAQVAASVVTSVVIGDMEQMRAAMGEPRASASGPASVQGAVRPVAAVSPFSDGALADQVVTAFGSLLRYTPVERVWHDWNTVDEGGRWTRCQKHEEHNYIKAIIRRTHLAATMKEAVQLDSGRTYAAVEKLLRQEAAITARPDDFDKDPMLLNTPSGVVDLRTGQLMRADPAFLMRMMTSVGMSAGAGGARPGRWLGFLDKITKGDKSLQNYLQRVGGYCLTGDISAQTFFFLHGPGGNGKSTFTKVLSLIMGDYTKTAPIETFTQNRFQAHSTELMWLRHARLVLTSEVPEGKTWNESRLKDLTGGENIVARGMGQDQSEFQLSMKLFVNGNHKPRLRSVDQAITRRIDLILLDFILSQKEVIGNLAERMVAEEGPMILAWLVEGCLMWQRDGGAKVGLQAPPVVTDATSGYLSTQDAKGEWLADSCEDRRGDGAATGEKLVNLWNAWKIHAESMREFTGSRSDFIEWLEKNNWVLRTTHADRHKIVIGCFMRSSGGTTALPSTTLTVVPGSENDPNNSK